jgi:hypothetical protein
MKTKDKYKQSLSRRVSVRTPAALAHIRHGHSRNDVVRRTLRVTLRSGRKRSEDHCAILNVYAIQIGHRGGHRPPSAAGHGGGSAHYPGYRQSGGGACRKAPPRLQNTCAAVSATAIQGKVSENMSPKMADVPMMSRTGETGELQVLDSAELAARWRVPESWMRNRTRARTPKEARIPCRRPGRHGRFEWGSPQLVEWPAKKRQ